ncbi:MAG: hypothetical protein V1720_12395 [bacterium]
MLKKFILDPLLGRLYGFSIFFTILLLTKLFVFTIEIDYLFMVDIGDILLSSIGFLLMFLIRLLSNFKMNKQKEIIQQENLLNQVE